MKTKTVFQNSQLKLIRNLRSFLLAAALMGTAGRLFAQVVFTENFNDGDISDWTAGSERDNNSGGTPDIVFAPVAVGGEVHLHAKGSCFGPDFDGVASTLAKTIPLPNGAYTLSYDVSHSTTHYDFCQGGTGGDSEILVNGVPISPVSCSVNNCGTCTVPTATVSGCFAVTGGSVELKLRTNAGDCADSTGVFDNITITVAPDADGDGIADACDACPNDAANDADGDGVCGDVDQCPNSNLSATVVIEGCDSGVANTVSLNGCSISDRIAQCAVGVKRHGDFVNCVAKLANSLLAQGVITTAQKDAILTCAGKSSIGGK